MQSVIQQIDEWATLTAAEIRTALLETVETPVETLVTFGSIHEAVGDENVSRLVISTVKAAAATDPLLDPSYIALSGVGIQLYSADRQAMVDQLAVAGLWPDEVRDAIKALGVTRESRWANLGGEGDVPSEAEIQATLDEIASAGVLQGKADAITQASAAVDQALREDTVGTSQEVSALFASTLATHWPEA